jgi:hypothetical protein
MTEQTNTQDSTQSQQLSFQGSVFSAFELQEYYSALIRDFIGMFPKRNQGDDTCQRHWLRLACAAVAVLERQPIIHTCQMNNGLNNDLSNYIATTEALKEEYVAANGATPQEARKALILKMISLVAKRVCEQDSHIRPKHHLYHITTIRSPIHESAGWGLVHDAQMDTFVPRRYPSSNQVTLEEIVQAIRDEFVYADKAFQQTEHVVLSEHARQRIGFVYSGRFINARPVRVMEMFSIPTVYKEFVEEPVHHPTRAHLIASQDSFLGDLS